MQICVVLDIQIPLALSVMIKGCPFLSVSVNGFVCIGYIIIIAAQPSQCICVDGKNSVVALLSSPESWAIMIWYAVKLVYF